MSATAKLTPPRMTRSLHDGGAMWVALAEVGTGGDDRPWETDAVSEQPGRYQRSFSGLIAAIVITLVAVGGFVVVRTFVRDDASNEPQTVDYLEMVGLAQEAGAEVVYPQDLPEGWRATSVVFVPGDRPAFGVGMLTDGGRFVGVRQEEDDLDDLLSTYVDEDAGEIADRGTESIDSAVAPAWQTFEDEGGDLAYAAEVAEARVLVYGSAGADDLRAVVEQLTTEPRGVPDSDRSS